MKLNFLLLFILLFSCSQLPSKRTDKLSILQGVTNSKEVEFSVVAPKGKILTFELRNAEGKIISPAETKVVDRGFSGYVIFKVVFERDNDKDYNLYVFEGSNLLDQRLIGRGPATSTKLKLAVASCSDDHFPQHFKIWEELAKRKPDYLLLIGDNVYADKSGSKTSVSANPEHIWNRYMDVRLSLPLYFQEKLIPTHALWDDHDFGLNDGGEEFPYKAESKEIFDAFYAQDLAVENWVKSFGVGGVLTLGDFNLYFLDGRSFRSASTDGRHLGADQYSWLMKKLNEEAGPSLLIKGDQFFGGYHSFDSYEGKHPKEFVQFTNDLSRVSAPYVFLSGDRHLSEIMQFPRSLFQRPSFEITSSPVHGRLFKGAKDTNPWRVVVEKEHVNFLMIDNLAKDNHWFLDVESIGDDGQVYFRRELAVYIKDLQNNLNEARRRRSGKKRFRRVRR